MVRSIFSTLVLVLMTAPCQLRAENPSAPEHAPQGCATVLPELNSDSAGVSVDGPQSPGDLVSLTVQTKLGAKQLDLSVPTLGWRRLPANAIDDRGLLWDFLFPTTARIPLGLHEGTITILRSDGSNETLNVTIEMSPRLASPAVALPAT